jgi:purine-nucleoside phosphorylase
MIDVVQDPYGAAREAAEAISRATEVVHHDVAVVLGSGWGPALETLGETTAAIAMADLPGFPAPGVAGHRGQVRSHVVGAHRVLVLAGRVHLYEGHDVAVVVHGVRTAAAAGARVVILTNAAGGIDRALRVGDAVLIADHLNLTGAGPTAGAEPPAEFGSLLGTPACGRACRRTRAQRGCLRGAARSALRDARGDPHARDDGR